GSARAAQGPVAVAVAPITRGAIADGRLFTATLEPSARVVVAAEVAGTIRKLHADLADEVQPDQVLVEIDDREYRQNEAAARAELAVARARASAPPPCTSGVSPRRAGSMRRRPSRPRPEARPRWREPKSPGPRRP